MNDIFLNANCWGTEDQQLLLKAAVLKDKLSIEAWQSWCKVKGADFDNIDYASYTLLPLVARNIGGLISNDVLLERCKGIYRRNWAHNHLLWRKILTVIRQFQQTGIEKIVLLKGMAMIANYYKDFGVRVIGDVDILIPKEQVENAVDILFASGWTANVPRFEPQMLTWHATDFKLDAETILDLHWSMIFESNHHIDQCVLRDAEPITLTSLKLYVPNTTDLLIQTCVHGLKHSPVPLIRWICDAMTILNQSQHEIDWERLLSVAKKAQICAALHAAFTYLNVNFGAGIPGNIIKQLSDTSVSRLERWENWGKQHDSFIVKSWTRFCMRNGYATVWQQIIHTPAYLQEAARLRYKWQIPIYSIYWIAKRLSKLKL